jgi:hypothetical protein
MNTPNAAIETSHVVRKLLLAIKNSTFYPPGHQILATSVTELYNDLHFYLEQSSNLVIAIDARRLISEGQVLHEGPKNKENIAFLLHRDGVQWISIEQGIEVHELQALLEIFRRYRIKEEYNGEDIVTALWQANFSHIQYGTDDRLWKDEPILDLSTLRLSSDTAASPELHAGPQQEAESLASADKSEALWVLTDGEKETTRQMIRQQEHRDDNLDVFDILLIILNEQNEKEDYAAVLDLVRECFERTLARNEFSAAVSFLKKMDRIYRQYKENSFWAQAYLDDFYIVISGQHLYAGLQKFIQNNKQVDRDHLIALRQMIALLPAQCIRSLGKLLPETNAPSLRQAILKSIALKAKENIGPLASLSVNEDDAIAIPAIGLLAHVNHSEALKLLKRQIQSDREKRRIAAVKAITRHPMCQVTDLEDVFDDPTLAVVKPILAFLARQKGVEASNLLMAQIETANFSRQEGALLLALYDCLGRCGSEQDVPFLQRQLFKIRFFSGAIGRLHRKGAAAALLQIQDKKARKVLEHASKSIRFSVRHACIQARERIREPAIK